MFNIKPDDLFNKTDQLLFSILEELKQLNKSLHPIAKDTVIKKPKAPKKGGPKLGKTNQRTVQNPQVYNPPL